MSKKVLIFIVSFNCPDALFDCINSISKLDEKNFEIHVFENGGETAFDKTITKFSENSMSLEQNHQTVHSRVSRLYAGRISGGDVKICYYLGIDNYGYSGAINALIETCAGRFDWHAVWILNPDVKVEPKSLSRIRSTSEGGNFDLVGCSLVFEELDKVQMRGGIWRRWIGAGKNIGFGESPTQIANKTEIERWTDYVSGAALFATRKYIDLVGPWDETYFLYCEEVDWCLRRGHLQIGFAEDSFVTHKHGGTLAKRDTDTYSPIAIYFSERNKFIITRKFYPNIFPIFVACSFCYLVFQGMRRGKRYFFAGARGWCDGLLGKTGKPHDFDFAQILRTGEI